MLVEDQIVLDKYNKLQSYTAVAKELEINRKTVSKIVNRFKATDNSDSSFLFSGMSNNGVFDFQFDAHGEFLFGVSSDQHLCSKYERLDLLNDLYDRFEKAGCKYVFNAGNWVDGEAIFNRYDIKVAGVNGQLEYLAKHYPQRKGITTYAVAGDDHEGWWSQRDGIDIGGYAQAVMRTHGRKDWVNMGYLQGQAVVHGKGGNILINVLHPGGGSGVSYSYASQKIVNHMAEGEKPDVLLIGHYHKQDYCVVRGVHAIQSGCTQDQSIFMKKKNLESHLGGAIVRLTQCPQTHKLIKCQVEFISYPQNTRIGRRYGV